MVMSGTDCLFIFHFLPQCYFLN